VARDDLDGIPLGDIANNLRPNSDLSFSSAGGKRHERIEILVAVEQSQSLLNAACRDQCVDSFSDGDAK